MTFNRVFAAAAVAAAAVAAFTPQADAQLLLSDNFTAGGTSDTFDINQNLPARQSGSLAPTTYTKGGTGDLNAQVGNPTMRVNGDGDYLLMAFGVRVSPDDPIPAGASAGGVSIRFDVAPDNNAGSDQWTAINIGMTEADRIVAVNGAEPHFGVLFRANGLIQAFDGPNAVSAGNETYGPSNLGGTDNNFTPVRVDLTDPIDGDPLDGQNQTDVNVYSSLVNNGTTPVYSFTKTGGGYSGRYINFNTLDIGGIDNLQITTIPEPTGLLSLAGLAGAALARRRRRGA